MTDTERRPGMIDQGGANDDLLGSGVGTEDTADPRPSDITRLLVPSLVAALDHLDDAGLCCCWVAPRGRRRCKAVRT